MILSENGLKIRYTRSESSDLMPIMLHSEFTINFYLSTGYLVLQVEELSFKVLSEAPKEGYHLTLLLFEVVGSVRGFFYCQGSLFQNGLLITDKKLGTPE